MKKFILLSLVGITIFSSESFGGRFKKGAPYKEKQDLYVHHKYSFKDHLRCNDQEWVNYKMQRLVKKGRYGGFSPHGDHFSDLLRGDKPRKQVPLLTRGTTFYIISTSRRFREQMTLPLLIQEGRENGRTPQLLRVPLQTRSIKNHPLLTRGSTIYIAETSDR